jgi:hypothetical protein
MIDMNNNQHDALFISSLLSYHISTCLGRINSPSSGGNGKGKGKFHPRTGHEDPEVE